MKRNCVVQVVCECGGSRPDLPLGGDDPGAHCISNNIMVSNVGRGAVDPPSDRQKAFSTGSGMQLAIDSETFAGGSQVRREPRLAGSRRARRPWLGKVDVELLADQVQREENEGDEIGSEIAAKWTRHARG